MCMWLIRKLEIVKSVQSGEWPICASSAKSLQVNPFELYSNAKASKSAPVDKDIAKEEGNFFREKLLNLITLLELLLSDDGTLPQKEKAFLYKCLIKTYENRGVTMDPATHTRQPKYARVLCHYVKCSTWR